MLKRTKGRLLITLLVVTGLAGTLHNSSISQKERNLAVSLLKNSRNEILQSISGLSAKQLDYRHPSENLSINQIILKLTQEEVKFRAEITTAMSLPASAENRLKITVTDDQLVEENNNYPIWKMNAMKGDKITGKDPAETIKKFITLRNDHIKYIRTSTEDLRNHVISTNAGWVDCYQFYLLLTDQSQYFAREIHKIRSSPHFPKK